MLGTVRRHAAIFKAVESAFKLSHLHCTIAESLLNFADCFRLAFLRNMIHVGIELNVVKTSYLQ
jgi:hypothetical protein